MDTADDMVFRKRSHNGVLAIFRLSTRKHDRFISLHIYMSVFYLNEFLTSTLPHIFFKYLGGFSRPLMIEQL